MSQDSQNSLLMLVEDSEDDAFFFERSFTKVVHNCAFHHSWNGEDAIKFLKISATKDEVFLPFAIFLDLKMPGLNGFDVLEWISAGKPFSGIPVIILSGSDEKNDKDRAKALGAVDYLVKPIKPAQLEKVMNEICANRHGKAPDSGGGV